MTSPPIDTQSFFGNLALLLDDDAPPQSPIAIIPADPVLELRRRFANAVHQTRAVEFTLAVALKRLGPQHPKTLKLSDEHTAAFASAYRAAVELLAMEPKG